MHILNENINMSIQQTKLFDLFNVIQDEDTKDHDKNMTDQYIVEIMSSLDLTKLKINWPKYLHEFYNNNLNFNDDNQKNLSKRIGFILTGDEKIVHQLNHLNRFSHMCTLFDKLNDLNVTFNKNKNFNNYTLARCQDYYLTLILHDENNDIITHWFNGIFNGVQLDGTFKSRYLKGIEKLKDFLKRQPNFYDNYDEHEKMVDKFSDVYGKWCVKYFTNKFDGSKMTLTDIFEKLEKVNKINDIFIPLYSSKIRGKIICEIIPCWKKYLLSTFEQNLKIDEYVINNFKNFIDVDIFCEPLIDYCNKWLDSIKKDVTPKNYSSPRLFTILTQISPILRCYISNNERKLINVLSKIYNFDQGVLGYIFVCINVSIKNLTDYKMTCEIKNTLLLLVMYENNDFMWSQYLKFLSMRITNITKKGNLNQEYINFELDIFNFLINNGCNSFSDKVGSYINNIKCSIENMTIIRKCKINYTDTNNKVVDPNIDLANISYNMIDKYIWDTIFVVKQNNNLIDTSKYPKQIKSSLSIGKTYYNLTSETKIFDWDIEKSIINYEIDDVKIISNIVQYIIIYNILDKQFTSTDLIKYIMNTQYNDAGQYIELYINNMISCGLIKYEDNILKFNKIKSLNIDISTYVPVVKQIKVTTKNDDIKNQFLISNESISYLRIMLITKMFKLNSTTVFPLAELNDSINGFMIDYTSNHKFSKEINVMLQSLTDTKEDQILKELKYLEKRDIIEMKTIDSVTGYIYVV